MLYNPARLAHVFCVRSRVDRHRADKGDGAFRGVEFRLRLTAVDAVAAHALKIAGFFLVGEQNCRRAYSKEPWTGVHGESYTLGGEDTVRVEGGGPGRLAIQRFISALRTGIGHCTTCWIS